MSSSFHFYGRLACLFLIDLAIGRAQQPAGGTPESVSPAASVAPGATLLFKPGEIKLDPASVAAAKADSELSREINKLCQGKHFDIAAMRLDQVLQANPKNFLALSLRGYVHAKQEKWALAEKDFDMILQINGKKTEAKFNLIELKFMQRNYAEAREGFSSLVADPDFGDLASYKVFLCDLFGGNIHKAKDELHAFDDVRGNPSYYFSHVAWEVSNQRPDAARPWLSTAARIYYPEKFEYYAQSLIDLGYLPFPKASPTIMGGDRSGIDTPAK